MRERERARKKKNLYLVDKADSWLTIYVKNFTFLLYIYFYISSSSKRIKIYSPRIYWCKQNAYTYYMYLKNAEAILSLF